MLLFPTVLPRGLISSLLFFLIVVYSLLTSFNIPYLLFVDWTNCPKHRNIAVRLCTVQWCSREIPEIARTLDGNGVFTYQHPGLDRGSMRIERSRFNIFVLRTRE